MKSDQHTTASYPFLAGLKIVILRQSFLVTHSDYLDRG
jgi:hypothetical protein